MTSWESYAPIIKEYEERMEKEQKEREKVQIKILDLLGDGPSEGFKVNELIYQVFETIKVPHDFILEVIWTMIGRNEIQLMSDTYFLKISPTSKRTAH